jgi:hypothetical protein
MGPLAAADTMMTVAESEAFAAGLVLQPAMMVNFQFKLSTGSPANIDKAGQAWRDVAQQLQQIGLELRQAVARVSRDAWSADDRTAYEQKVEQFCAQLNVMHAFCMAVGVALTAFAYALFSYAVFAVGMGGFLGALAAVAAAALASVFGAELYPACEAIAATCLTITTAATAILAAAAQLAAVAFQGGALLSAVTEHFRGNDAALGDFVQAEATGSAAALANLSQNALNAGLAYANRSGGIKVPGGGKGSPLRSVDLDADRDKDHTWNVGGGVTGKNWEAGAHVKWGDDGFAGGDVKGKYGEFGGEAGWDHNRGEDGYSVEVEGSKGDAGVTAGYQHGRDGKDTASGGLAYSHENQKTGHGGTIGVDGKYTFDDDSWEATGKGGYTYQGGEAATGSYGVEGDDKGVQQKGSFESWVPRTGDQTPENE